VTTFPGAGEDVTENVTAVCAGTACLTSSVPSVPFVTEELTSGWGNQAHAAPAAPGNFDTRFLWRTLWT